MAYFQGEITMAKNTHLTLDDRATIEISLREGKSFTEIGKELGKDPMARVKAAHTEIVMSIVLTLLN